MTIAMTPKHSSEYLSADLGVTCALGAGLLVDFKQSEQAAAVATITLVAFRHCKGYDLQDSSSQRLINNFSLSLSSTRFAMEIASFARKKLTSNSVPRSS